MRDLGLDLTVTVDVVELITLLLTNREEHIAIYKEAVKGCKTKTRRLLEVALGRCTGREDVHVHISAPQNNESAYVSAIHMLEMHLAAGNTTIAIDASTFRKLAENEWDWMHNWLAANAGYSDTAACRLGHD